MIPCMPVETNKARSFVQRRSIGAQGLREAEALMGSAGFDTLRAEKPYAAAVHAGGNANIEPLLQWLEPTQCHPIPASALPVAIASSSCSVEPPKLIKSTSRLCFAKTPRSFATGAAAEQTEVAFHASLSARGGPDNRSPVIAARQRGNSSGGGQS